MDTITNLFNTMVYCFAVAGFIVVFSLAWIGFKMVYLAINFSLQYSYAEYQARKLKKASPETRKKMSPDIDAIPDEELVPPADKEKGKKA